MSNDLQPRQRGPIAWMAGNSVASNLVMLMCLVGGFLALLNVKQEVFPDIEPDIVTVTVPFPGASPEEVEEGILESIEEAVRSLDGVDEVTSVAREGSGTVNVEALLGADLQRLSQDIQNEVDRITTFPDEAEEPEVRIATHRRGVLDLLIAGDIRPTVLRALGEQVRDMLLQDERITQVELTGIPDLEIAVEVPEEQLRRYGLTLREVANRIRAASIDLPAGGLDTASGEILVRVKERRDFGREFARIPIITTTDGAVVRLGDIATIDDGFEDTDQYTLLNDKLAVELEVHRVGDQTPLDVSAAVYEHMDEIQAMLPPGVIAEIQHDRSTYYQERVELLLKNGALGLVLVLVVLGLFLEARLAFWVMMGIPISFLGSFLILPSTGVTINMMSLFAYIVALGIVVDDAIVVGENVYHYHQEGMPFAKAAVKGAREVAMPVTFSILTNVVAFMPMLFIPGVTGKIFMMIPAVVITVFMISLVESLFVLPAHLAHQKDRRRYGLAAMFHNAQQRFSRAFTNWVKNRYGPFLEFCLHHRVVTVSIAVALLLASIAYAASGRMGFELFPVVESDRSEATVVLPYGAPVEKTQAVLDRIEAGAKKVLAESGRPELVTSITADIGRGGSHTGRVRVELAEADLRSEIMSTLEFTRRWRQAVGEIEGVEFMKFAADSGGPGSRGRPVEVQLSHRDIDVLRDASEELASEVETYPRVKDVDDGFQPGKRQLDFKLTPEGKSLGLTAAEVARQARAALYGAEALRQQRGRSEIKVMVRLPGVDRSTEQTAQDLMIATPAGTYVPLREVATMERGRAYTTIDRRKGRRVVTVSADVTPRARAGEVLGDLQSTALKDLTTKYPGLTYSFEGAQADIAESMGSLKVMFVVALLAIYAMLAIPFRSYAQPLIVMVSIPFGIVGAFVGHLIMGYSLAIPSMFGIVALAGVVVNDSLVLVDYANRRRREDGMNYHDSVTAAGIQRFRPVVLTTLTTFGGLAPMIFETSRQARFLIPMALSLGFGILFATAITLILVPTLYMSIEDITRKTSALKRWLFPAHEPTGDAPAPTGVVQQTEESERSS
ncbi:MAG: efflux RND transporter permease subunit [Planctomycetota bacterium]